ncbi:Ig-like domain-containing protein [Pontiella sp.]|uniref:Ig-like domain-containing protein n=1 Tax=Pontiella sp. TaxID=2837462 RepID=UPI00356AEE06
MIQRACILLLVLGGWAVSSPAALEWTGAAGNGLFTEGSWLDDTGSVPAAGTIEGDVAITADTGSEKRIEIISGTGQPNNWWSNFHVGNNSLTISNKLVKADAGQIAGGKGQVKGAWEGAGQVLKVLGGGTLQVGDVRNFGTVLVDNATVSLTRYISTSTATGENLTITNGSTFSASYISGYAQATVDATSSLILNDASNPLRNDIHLAEGAELTLSDSTLFSTEGARIFVGGVSYAGNPSILKITGNTAVAGTFEGPVFGSPFQNGMVLQRGKPVKVWGTAVPTNEVVVSIHGSMAAGMSDLNGDWMVELPALSAGGPYTLQAVSNGETNTLADVLVGDVWIAFGQSNMVRPLSEMTNKQSYIDAITTNRMIRCLQVAQDAALTPQDSGAMTWLDNSNPGSWGAVAAVFAHQMHEGSGVPAAVIWAGWGSSSIEGWMPVQMTDGFPHFDAMMDHYQSIGEYISGDTISSRVSATYSSNLDAITAMVNGTGAWDDIFIRTRPNIIYNQRIHPLLNFGISGFVWYQGEANAGTPENVAQYGFTLPAFVEEYRELFGQGDLPFLGVQLPSYNSTYWAWFRESQSRVTALNNAHVAVTLDTGDPGDIHPYDKEPIGQRLALLGRKYALGEDLVAHGPTFESMEVDGTNVTVSFAYADGLTTDDALAPAAFELAGSDQVWHAATQSSISGSQVVISSGSVGAPVAVRYAWSPAPVNELNLVNSAGLPAAPFRTDDWPATDLGAQAPQAIPDAYSVSSNETLVVSAPGVLENDIDLNRDVLTASLVSDATYGTLSLASDGSFSYAPDAGFAGHDSFQYAVSDGALSATGTVSLAVNLQGLALGFHDDFDDDGLSANDGRGGGMVNLSISGVAFSDDGNLTGEASGIGSHRAAVHTSSAFPVENGFRLEVIYNVVDVSENLGNTASFGLIDAVDASKLDGLFVGDKGLEGIGMSLTGRNGLQGLNELSDAGLIPLSSNQTVTAGSGKIFRLVVTPDGGFSYSIDGAAPSTGTTGLDLTKPYYFAAYTQRNADMAIQRVLLTPITAVTHIGSVSGDVVSQGAAMQFSWDGEIGASYVLESTDDLVAGSWAAVTTIWGNGESITVSDDVDQTHAFFRVAAED